MNDGPLELGRIQQWMQSVITNPGGIAAGIASHEAREAIDIDPANAETLICRSRAQTSLERLQIYGNAYYARLLECLRDEYPALVHALGDDAFNEFAFGYLQAYPSTSYTLARLGANFAGYLRETRPPREDVCPEPDWADFLIDLARLERAYAEVFDGPGTEDHPHLQPQELLAVPPDRWASMQLVPAECLRLMTFDFPVHEYASAVRRDDHPSPPEASPTWLAVTRRDYVVRRLPLSAAQFELLGAILDGRTLREAIEASALTLDGSLDELAGSLRDWFAEWSAAGLFGRVE